MLRVLEAAEDNAMPVDVFPQNVGMRRSGLFPRPKELLKIVLLSLNHFAEFGIPLASLALIIVARLSFVLTRPLVHPPTGR